MAKRYSGNVVVNVVWDDRRDAYRATVAENGRHVWSGIIGRAPASRLAVDSSEAYDEAAVTALAFADNDEGLEGVEYTDSGRHIRRVRVRRIS